MTALLVVNLAFGVMSRAAPTLNLFAVGFPVSLIAGLLIVYAGLPTVQASFVELLEAAFDFVRALQGEARPWPRTTHKNEQNRQHLSASKRRARKARSRVRAISARRR